MSSPKKKAKKPQKPKKDLTPQNPENESLNPKQREPDKGEMLLRKILFGTKGGLPFIND